MGDFSFSSPDVDLMDLSNPLTDNSRSKFGVLLNPLGEYFVYQNTQLLIGEHIRWNNQDMRVVSVKNTNRGARQLIDCLINSGEWNVPLDDFINNNDMDDFHDLGVDMVEDELNFTNVSSVSLNSMSPSSSNASSSTNSNDSGIEDSSDGMTELERQLKKHLQDYKNLNHEHLVTEISIQQCLAVRDFISKKVRTKHSADVFYSYVSDVVFGTFDRENQKANKLRQRFMGKLVDFLYPDLEIYSFMARMERLLANREKNKKHQSKYVLKRKSTVLNSDSENRSRETNDEAQSPERSDEVDVTPVKRRGPGRPPAREKEVVAEEKDSEPPVDQTTEEEATEDDSHANEELPDDRQPSEPSQRVQEQPAMDNSSEQPEKDIESDDEIIVLIHVIPAENKPQKEEHGSEDKVKVTHSTESLKDDKDTIARNLLSDSDPEVQLVDHFVKNFMKPVRQHGTCIEIVTLD